MKLLRTILTALLVTPLAVVANYRSHTWQEKTSTKLHRSEFRYLIVSNNLLHNGRIVSVLFSEQAFSEVNLKKLFMLLSKRYPEPDELHVVVYTSLEQVPTPEEEDHNKLLPSNEEKTPVESSVAGYPFAIYTRWDENEVFSYRTGTQANEKTIVLKGENVLRKQQKLP